MPIEGFLIRLLTTFLAALLWVGCGSSNSSRIHYAKTTLKPFIGVWEGEGTIYENNYAVPVHITLSVSETQSRLEFRVAGSNDPGPFFCDKCVRGDLELLGDAQGRTHFIAKDLKLEGIQEESLQWFPWEDISLRFETDRRGASTEPSLSLNSRTKQERPQAATGFSRENPFSVVLSKSEVLGKGYSRFFGSKSLIAYRDWRYGEGHALNAPLSRPQESKKRLAQDFEALKKDGWRCLSQANREIPTQGGNNIVIPSSIDQMILIYSWVPDERITYSIELNGEFYVHSGSFNFPVIYQRSPGTLSLKITTQPIEGDLERNAETIPITIFALGNGWFDYGGGCQLEEFGMERVLKFDKFQETFAKVVVAVGAEVVRRHSEETGSDIGQLLAGQVRDKAIESALHDLAPNTSESTLGYFSRWASLLVSNELDLGSFTRETLREYIVQQIKAQHPEYADDAELIDFLVEAALQQRAKSRQAVP